MCDQQHYNARVCRCSPYLPSLLLEVTVAQPASTSSVPIGQTRKYTQTSTTPSGVCVSVGVCATQIGHIGKYCLFLWLWPWKYSVYTGWCSIPIRFRIAVIKLTPPSLTFLLETTRHQHSFSSVLECWPFSTALLRWSSIWATSTSIEDPVVAPSWYVQQDASYFSVVLSETSPGLLLNL